MSRTRSCVWMVSAHRSITPKSQKLWTGLSNGLDEAIAVAVQALRVVLNQSSLLLALCEIELVMHFPETAAQLLMHRCDCVRGSVIADLARIAKRLLCTHRRLTGNSRSYRCGLVWRKLMNPDLPPYAEFVWLYCLASSDRAAIYWVMTRYRQSNVRPP